MKKHECPVFFRVKCCFTELDHAQKNRYGREIEALGGTIAHELTSTCDVLITLVHSCFRMTFRMNPEDLAQNMSGPKNGPYQSSRKDGCASQSPGNVCYCPALLFQNYL